MRPPANRLVYMFAGFVAVFVLIIGRLATLQVAHGERLSKIGTQERLRTFAIPAERGQILDRTGVPLAITLQATDIYADPSLVSDPLVAASRLAPVLGVDETQLRSSLMQDGTFAYLLRQGEPALCEQVLDMGLEGIGCLPSERRSYPGGNLAAQVLGFVGTDGVGLSGLEMTFNELLSGKPGTRTAELSRLGLPLINGVDREVAPVPGQHLVTTIDRQMQYQAQVYLARAVSSNYAKAGTIVVLDRGSGDVLAMASYPSFDPNRFGSSSEDARRNRAVTDTFEPGSVNKTITVAAALDAGAVRAARTFMVPDTLKVDRYTIHDSEDHATESMTVGDIVAMSSNVGATLIARELGAPKLAAYMDAFGYGRRSGLTFPGEATGYVPPISDWRETTLAAAAFGQAVSVTPLQMAGVYGTIANNGVWVQPRLVKGFRDSDGVFHEAPAAKKHRVISPQVAQTMTEMLAYVVSSGTGIRAQIPGYQVAGKTGTAHKVGASGEYVNRYMASFVGFLPAGNPRLIIAVTIDEPRTEYGGIAAAPAFQDVARYAIQRFGIPAAEPVALPPRILTLGP